MTNKDFDKHRKSEALNLKEIREYFENSGYSVIKIEQLWRHVTGVLQKSNKKYFLKLASTLGVAERTQNEYAWNKLINSMNVDIPISVPNSYESGFYNDLFWFVSDFIDGEPLVHIKASDETAHLEENLSKIARTAAEILKINPQSHLPHDKKRNETEDLKKLFLARLQHWMNQFEQDATGLYNFIDQNLSYAQEAPCHGDFVPWHILRTKEGKLYLIDGEHAKIHGFKFYDVAYFYHRVYTKLKRPDISDEFLNEFSKIYNFTEADKICFRVILAQRVIGGYIDAKNDGVTSLELQDALGEKVLNASALS